MRQRAPKTLARPAPFISTAILHFDAEALGSALRRTVSDVDHRSCRPSRRFTLARRAIQRVAVRTGQADRGAAEEETQGRGAVFDRLWSVGPAAYRHIRRGCAYHHGAP